MKTSECCNSRLLKYDVNRTICIYTIFHIVFFMIVSLDIPDKQGLAERLMELYEMFEI